MKKLLTLITLCLISTFVFSQGPPPLSPCPVPPCAPIPLDNGISFLIIVGVLFGIYKIYSFKKKQHERPNA